MCKLVVTNVMWAFLVTFTVCSTVMHYLSGIMGSQILHAGYNANLTIVVNNTAVDESFPKGISTFWFATLINFMSTSIGISYLLKSMRELNWVHFVHGSVALDFNFVSYFQTIMYHTQMANEDISKWKDITDYFEAWVVQQYIGLGLCVFDVLLLVLFYNNRHLSIFCDDDRGETQRLTYV